MEGFPCHLHRKPTTLFRGHWDRELYLMIR